MGGGKGKEDGGGKRSLVNIRSNFSSISNSPIYVSFFTSLLFLHISFLSFPHHYLSSSLSIPPIFSSFPPRFFYFIPSFSLRSIGALFGFFQLFITYYWLFNFVSQIFPKGILSSLISKIYYYISVYFHISNQFHFFFSF